MKTLKFNLLVLFAGISGFASSQCPDITCPADSVHLTSSCDAVINYAVPVGVDTCSSITATFSYTGSEQTWVVPAGVTSITVDAYGAQGGANWVSNNNFGGHTQATISVTPGTTIYIYVGQQPNGITGGWNGGGNGEGAGQGGGGATDIRIGGNTLNDRIIVAGGGGGAGYWSSEHVIGGVGGGLIGGYGSRTDYATSPGGEPGTQSGSGNGTCVSLNNPVCTGGFGYGGAPSSCGCEGYGGGGGWYGGAGSGNCRGGGGGSSYTDPAATNVLHEQGVRTGNGELTISYPNSSNVVTSLIAGLSSGSTYPIGTTTMTYQAEITNIDTAWCSFTVTVIDTVSPSISAPANVEHCGSSPVSNIAPIATDNCSYTVNYTISGATTGSGSDDVSGTAFNSGVSTIWYYISDASNNMDSASFTVTVTDLPTVTLDNFTVSSICTYNAPIALPSGSPASGVYSGSGVSGGMFDPSISGIGTIQVYYTYTDSGTGCSNSDSSQIIVDECLGLEIVNNTDLITIYPNPTDNKVQINLPEVVTESNWYLYTTTGKLIKTGMASESFQLDITNEDSGIYLFSIQIENIHHVYRIMKK